MKGFAGGADSELWKTAEKSPDGLVGAFLSLCDRAAEKIRKENKQTGDKDFKVSGETIEAVKKAFGTNFSPGQNAIRSDDIDAELTLNQHKGLSEVIKGFMNL